MDGAVWEDSGGTVGPVHISSRRWSSVVGLGMLDFGAGHSTRPTVGT